MSHDPRFHNCPHVIGGEPCQGKANFPLKVEGRQVYKCTRCNRFTTEADLRIRSEARTSDDDEY